MKAEPQRPHTGGTSAPTDDASSITVTVDAQHNAEVVVHQGEQSWLHMVGGTIAAFEDATSNAISNIAGQMAEQVLTDKMRQALPAFSFSIKRSVEHHQPLIALNISLTHDTETRIKEVLQTIVASVRELEAQYRQKNGGQSMFNFTPDQLKQMEELAAKAGQTARGFLEGWNEHMGNMLHLNISLDGKPITSAPRPQTRAPEDTPGQTVINQEGQAVRGWNHYKNLVTDTLKDGLKWIGEHPLLSAGAAMAGAGVIFKRWWQRALLWGGATVALVTGGLALWARQQQPAPEKTAPSESQPSAPRQTADDHIKDVTHSMHEPSHPEYMGPVPEDKALVPYVAQEAGRSSAPRAPVAIEGEIIRSAEAAAVPKNNAGLPLP